MEDGTALFDTKSYKYNQQALNLQQEAALYHRLSVHLAYSWCSQQAMMMMPPMPSAMPYGIPQGWFPGSTGPATFPATNTICPQTAPVANERKKVRVSKSKPASDSMAAPPCRMAGPKPAVVPATGLPEQANPLQTIISTVEDDLSCDDLFKIFNDLGGQDAGELSSIISNGSDDSGALNNGLGGDLSLSRRGSILADTHASSLPLGGNVLPGRPTVLTPHHTDPDADHLLLDLDMYMERELVSLKEPSDSLADLHRAVSGPALPMPVDGCTGWPAPPAPTMMRAASTPVGSAGRSCTAPGMGSVTCSGSGASSPALSVPKIKGGVKKVTSDQRRDRDCSQAFMQKQPGHNVQPPQLAALASADNNAVADELLDTVGGMLDTNSMYALGWMEDVTGQEGLTA